MRSPTWCFPPEMCLRRFLYLVPNFMIFRVVFFLNNIDDITIYTMDKRTFAEKYIQEKKKKLHFNYLHPTFDF